MKYWQATKTYVMAVLKNQRGDRAGAARVLGMGVRTLNMKLRRWGLDTSIKRDQEQQSQDGR